MSEHQPDRKPNPKLTSEKVRELRSKPFPIVCQLILQRLHQLNRKQHSKDESRLEEDQKTDSRSPKVWKQVRLQCMPMERKVTKSDRYDHIELPIRLSSAFRLEPVATWINQPILVRLVSSDLREWIGSWSCFTPGLWSFARSEVVLSKNGWNRAPGQTYETTRMGAFH